ncbi:MAG: hypothetical protein A2075_16780 [Geobacteraceae bacterium GWC2_58_44]|nr:MAG: hypothetical protein A2075_16780 [Geobacteraceae bacterium GWC2_58_44]
MARPDVIDRLSIRQRPGVLPLMYQSWRKLLFMHWRLPAELLRPHVPERLRIDTFDGEAWVGITPFLVRNLRPAFLPALPWLSDFDEVNVRTYVHHDGVPGVWFFSLDASSLLAVIGASAAYRLPYRYAEIIVREEKEKIVYSSRRAGSAAEPAVLKVSWLKGDMVGEAEPESLEFFLVERYCLYAAAGNDLYRARIFHPPWKLQTAELISCRSTLLEAQRLPKPEGHPLLHYSELQDTSIWPLKKVT